MKRAVVYAHCDDETLWAGGYLVRNPDTDVFTCSRPVRDTNRLTQFHKALDILGVTGQRTVSEQLDAVDGVVATLRPPFDLSSYDEVSTHGFSPAHKQHTQVHTWVRGHFHGRIRVYSQGGTLVLTDEEWRRKVAALQCYDTPHRGEPGWELSLKIIGITLEHLRFELFAILPR